MPKSTRPSGSPSSVDDEVTPLDGDDFLAANRSNRERYREEAERKAERAARRGGGDRSDADQPTPKSEPESESESAPGSAAPSDRTPGIVEPVRRRRRPGKTTIALIVLSVLVVALAVSTAWFAYAAVRADDQAAGPTEAARQETMDLARDYAAQLASYDPKDYADLDRRIQGISTPEFAKTYITSSQDARRGNASVQGTSHAESKEAGLQSISDSKAVVLVTLDQTVRSPDVSAQVPQGIPYQSRVKVTLVRQDGRWLLSDFDTV
ncbi:hypothetical protein AAFP35_25085 [Gordonia sp. CPCC 206044]|uniref:hypothetical protein n=1 Tax=Gordonia sp. CPCC 206044 TaxID=3140793 RepID=UPI003AF39DD7